MTEHADNKLSPNKRALLKIRELKQELSDARQGNAEPIAIVSMACRFPRRSHTPEEFWTCLLEQTDEVSEIPNDRWDLDAFYDEDPEAPGKMYARHGVFLDNLDLMDPEFFGISPREATWVDPQQRLLMEVGWEALERAGWPAEKIGFNTGVFIGWMHNDYQNEASDSFLNLNPYIATGAAGSFLCGRLAYYLGLQGPSIAVDTACSSSLVALHLACQSLQRGDCERALVGGVNAILSPTTNILTCKLKALSPQGHSRAFDAAADGYLRGEGCGMVTLRKLSDAQRDGDPILGIIRATAVGHNGSSSGLTAPNPKAQEQIIRQALGRAGIDSSEVAYLEAHGTGTELGDPIEIQAAAAALASNRGTKNPLLVGSVKTNIGHLEAAAGMAGLIKVLLAIEHQQIPAQLNFDVPNPHIPWDKLPVKVVTQPTKWPEAGNKRIAGVSAFGMSGTNAHAVIEAPDTNIDRESDTLGTTESNEPKLIVLSSKSEQALQELGGRYKRHLSGSHQCLSDIAYTTCVGRSHMAHRAAMVVRGREQAIDKSNTLSRLGNSESLFRGSGRRAPKIAWQFTGQGAQYVGMARALYSSQQVFRDAIDHCDRLMQDRRGASLTEVMFEHPDLVNHTSWTQPAIFAVQMGLARLLESWGLSPDAVLGHSVGQYSAACVAGMMSWDDGLYLISERGRLIGDLPTGGRMLAVFAPPAEVNKQLDNIHGVGVAALNGTHVVVSGAEAAVAEVEEGFRRRKIRTTWLTTSHAFHSALMDPAVAPFQMVADQVRFQPGSVPLVCNVTGTVLDADTALDGAYWAQHIRKPVRYADSIEAVQQFGCDVLLELGPQAVLTRMATAIWKGPGSGLISCLQNEVDDTEALLQAIGQLYVHGATPDFDALYAGKNVKRVLLPTYPFQRRRFWGPDKPRAFHAQFHSAHPLLGGKVALAGDTKETRFASFIEPDGPAWLPDHEVMGHTVMPGAAFVEMALAAAGGLPLKDLAFERPLQPASRTAMQTIVKQADQGGTSIQVYSSPVGEDTWTRHFTCKCDDHAAKRMEAIDRSKLEAACPETATPEEFYRKMRELGLHYGPEFQTISSISYSEVSVLTRLKTAGDMRGYSIPPTLLDGALHSLAMGLLRDNNANLYLPVGIKQVEVLQAIENEIWCHAQWKKSEENRRTADIILFTDTGQVVARVEGLQVQQIDREALRQLSGTGSEGLLYDLGWQKFQLPPATSAPTRWLLVDADQSSPSLALRLAEQLEQQGHTVIRASLASDTAFKNVGPSHFAMCPEASDNWGRLFEESFPPDGIAWIFDSADPDLDNGRLSTTTKLQCSGLLNLVATLRERGLRKLQCGLQLITSDAVAANEDAQVDANQSQYWGLARVIGSEHPEMRCRVIDVASDEAIETNTITSVGEILITETHDSQLAIRNGSIMVPRLKPAKVPHRLNSNLNVRPDASYLITGGLGMLGRQAAKWLAEKGAKQVVLVSRREPDEDTRDFLKIVESLGCEVVVHSANISLPTDVKALFDRFGADLQPLAGVIHAAGVLDDGLLEDQSWARFEKVLTPKVIGARLLDEFTRDLPLDFFVLYSSAASVLGPPGQSNYATANAYLDGLAWQRRVLSLPALSINWGPWTEGMANEERVRKRLALQGFTPLSANEAHDAMEKSLAAGLAQATVLDVDWQRMRMGIGGEAPALLDELISAKPKSQAGESEMVAKLKRLRGAGQKELLVATIQSTLQGILSTSDLPEIDRPLIEMGLDSLMAVELSTELQFLLGDQLGIGPTMLFDHPTIDAISDHVLELIAGGSEEGNVDVVSPDQKIVEPTRAEREDVAIIGMSCHFPGARNIDEFWQNLLNEVDSVRQIPGDRWDIDRFYSAEQEPGKMYTREGGFLDDIADFDAEFFNISEQEACWIDPQHRMLLENSYRALEDAGISAHPVPNANVGVFMGIMGQDYAFLPSLDDEHVIREFQGAGLSHSAGVGRISYVFGFEGPSVAVDTASSSSLVALFQAVRSLQDGNCNMALAGGVNAILAPVNSLLMCKAGLLSPDGRCRSFSAGANGFGRGEGCGVVVLKRLSDAERDGDRIMAIVRGGAVVHNGSTGGITSPSGKAQARVITQALKDARLAPSQVQYLEAHGTGTELGDSMELSSASSVYGRGRKPEEPLLVGSVKANISHLEAAGGISGLIKSVLSMHHGVIPPQIHFNKPSQHIPWDRLPVKMVTEQTAWPGTEERIAGVTALGLVGTNAHVILSALPQTRPRKDADENMVDSLRSTHLLVWSARNDQALIDLAAEYLQYLEYHPDVELRDFCATLATGRRHHEHRIALTASSHREMLQKLIKIADGESTRLTLHCNGSNSQNGHVHFDHAVAEPNAKHHGNRSISTPRIAWVISDLDASQIVKAHELYQAEPVFREFITGCDRRLSEHAKASNKSVPRLEEWFASTADLEQASDVHIFALQAGLAKVWRSWGIEPDVVLGCGVGQYTAACIAGGLCFFDALTLIVERQNIIGKVQRDRQGSEQSRSVTDLSQQSRTLLDQFELFADTLNYYPPNLPLFCSLSASMVPVHRSLGGSYWRQHCLGSSHELLSVQKLIEQDPDYVLEFGSLNRVKSVVDYNGHWLQVLQCDQDPTTSMLEALGELYVGGTLPDFKSLYSHEPFEKLSLPTYPFQKKRYWITEISDHVEQPDETIQS